MTWLFARLVALRGWLTSFQERTEERRFIARVFVVFLTALTLGGRALPAAAQSTTGTPLGVETAINWFADVAYSLAMVITRGIVLLIDALVPIMLYNDFTNNPVVNAGWAIVRDTVNMFFVIVLIVIAFGTIFGHSKFKWQQQVPRLLIFAVAINFSKTLCGIMIDFGQVIMLTFANSLREIAAGNFIQLFGLNQLYSASGSSTITEQAGEAIYAFAGGMAAVAMSVIVFAVLLILLAILLFRIIMLWVLVVIAPLTWFAGGAQDVLGSKAYAEWWNEFKCLVAVGPVLTFFLWLTLSVAGAGNMAALSNFQVEAGSNNADFANEALELQNFMSFLIGIAMIVAGWKAAMDLCSGMSGGIIKNFKSIPKTAVGLSARVGATGARLGLRGARRGARAVAGGARYIPGSSGVGRLGTGVADVVRKLPSAGLGAAGAVASGMTGGLAGSGLKRAAIKSGAKVDQQRRERELERMNTAGEKMKGYDTDTKAKLAESLAEQSPSSAAGQAQAMELLGQAMSDKGLQKKLKESGALEKLWSQYGDRYQSLNSGNAAKTGAINDFKRSNAFVHGEDGPDREAVEELVQDFDDAKGLSTDMLKNETVQERLKSMNSGFVDNDGNAVNAHDALIQRGNKDQAAALREALVASQTDSTSVASQINDQYDRAVEFGNADNETRVMKDLENAYTQSTDSQEKQRLERSMARMKASIDRRAAENGGTPPASTFAFQEMQERIDKLGYQDTALPPVTEGTNMDSYLGNFEGSTEDRKNYAVRKLSAEANSAGNTSSSLAGEIKGSLGNEAIAQQLENKRSAYVQRRQQAEQAAYAQAHKLEEEVQAAENLAAEAKLERDRGGADEVDDALAYVEEMKKRLQAAQTAARRRIENDGELNTIQDQMDALIENANDLSPDNISEVKDKNKQVVELETRAARLREAQSKLQNAGTS